MNFYELEDSLQPRVFILSCNENALVIQSTMNESKIVLRNDTLTDYYVISASNEDLAISFRSNVISQFRYINGQAHQITDRIYLNQLEIQPSSSYPSVFNSNAQWSYSNNLLQLNFPSSTHTFQVNGNIISAGTIYASNLQITGESVILNTVTSNTEEMIITNLGSGPALKVTQIGATPVAEFYDDETLTLIVADGGSVGIRTAVPRQTLDVYGSQIVSGNLGIGTTEPRYPLDVIGDIKLTGNLIQNETTFVSSQWTTSGSNIYYTIGNVGIGTTDPQSTLAIGTGPYDVTSTLMFNGGDDVTNVDKLYWTFLKNGSKIGHSSGWNVNHYAGQEGTIDGISNGNFHFFTGSSGSYNERLTILNNGSVGIGSTQPANRLDVNGNSRFYGSVTINNNNLDTGSGLISTSNLLFNGEEDQPGIKLYWTYYENGSKIGHSNGWNVNHYAGRAGYAESSINGNFHFYTGGNPNYNERLTILNSGNIGIGSTQPNYKLDVNGNAYITGPVGIGTNSFTSSLNVSTGLDIIATNTWAYTDYYVDETGYIGVGLNPNTNGDDAWYGYLWNYRNYGIQFGTNNIERMRIDNLGNVGIGTIQPLYKLDVAGNAYISGPLVVNNTITASSFIGIATQVGQDLIRGTYLTGTNYNGSTSTTWAVDADTANTANKIVARDASGNFSAGTITATLSGTATQVSQNLTRGTYLTGTNYNGSISTTWAVDADSANTVNKVVVRDASGNFSAGTITATLSGTATKVGQDLIRGTYLTGTNYNGAGTTTWTVDATTTATANKIVARDASGNIYATNVGIGTTVVRTNLDVIGNTLISGNVGIGTSPESSIISKLYINISGTTQDAFRIDNGGGAITHVSGPFLVDKFGNVGIGLATPTAALHVDGNVSGGGKIAAIVKAGKAADKALQIIGANASQTGNLLEVYRDVSSTIPDLIIDGSGANLGIGTTVARQKLDIQGGNAIVFGNIGIGTTIPLKELDVRGTMIATALGIGTTTPRAEVDIIGNTLHTGNIGIGTTTAKYPIHVHSAEDIFTLYNGKVGISYGAAISPSTDLEIRNSLDTDYTGVLLTSDGNNYPTASLRIESKRYDQSTNIAYAGNMGLYRYNNNASLTSNVPLGLIHFGGNHTSGSTANKAFSAYLGAISEEAFVSSSTMRTAIVFAPGSNAYNYYDTTLAHTNEKMRLNSYGNLGIGTTSPTTTLDVRGNILMGKGVNGIYNSFIGGPYHQQAGWDATGTSHTIAYPNYCMADNSSGTLHIQVKSATADKLGNASVSFLKVNATAVDLFNIHYHKTTNLTTFTITASTNDITITTDSDCAVAWTSIGSC